MCRRALRASSSRAIQAYYIHPPQFAGRDRCILINYSRSYVSNSLVKSNSDDIINDTDRRNLSLCLLLSRICRVFELLLNCI